MGVNAAELQDAVSDHLGLRCVEFSRNGYQGFSSETFFGWCENGQEIFIKVAKRGNEYLDRSIDAMEACRGLPFVASVLPGGSFLFHGQRVVCTNCLRGMSTADLELLSDAQAIGLACGYVQFSERIQTLRAKAVAGRTNFTPESSYGLIRAYASLHPVAGRLLRPLLNMPEEDRRLAGHRLSVIHNDFANKNLAYSPDGLAAIYDCDSLALGVPTEDLAYGVTNRMRTANGRVRRRVRELFRLMVRNTPWTPAEWRFAVNSGRLLWAALELVRRRKSPMVALKIARRDRRIRELLKEVG